MVSYKSSHTGAQVDNAVEQVLTKTEKVQWGNVEGDITTQNDLQDALGEKQDTLIAGANIAIEDNVISASGELATIWGNITGSLSNQTDLQIALDSRIIKVSTLPEPSSSLLNLIVQYVGETSTEDGVINAYFYKCVMGDTDYEWENVNVQHVPTVDDLNYTVTPIVPSTTNFVEGTTYSVSQSIQRTANLFEGYKEDFIDVINEKIPAQASATNQLADKAFVNSSIASNASSFRGNWATWSAVPTDSSQYPADTTGSTVPTTNNYIIVTKATDYSSENEGTWRFTYTGVWSTDGKDGWKPTYQVGSAFTPEQQAAIDSGATTTSIKQIDTNTKDIGDLKADKVDQDHSSGNKVYGTSNDGSQVTYIAGDHVQFNEKTNSSTGTTTYNISADVNNATLTIQKNGTNVQTFSANQSTNATANITVPTKVSELTNDTGYITSSGSITGNAATATSATKATQDGSGNVITSTYVKLTGNQTIAGTKTFSSTIAGSINGNAATATKATQDSSGNQINTNYQPIKYSRYAISTYASTNPYIKLATVTFSDTTNYDISNLFWVEALGASTSKSYALVRLSARWVSTSYTGTKFEILEKYGDNVSLFDSLVFAYSYTTTSSKGSIVGEVWMTTSSTSYFTYYFRPTQCNEYGDYSQTNVTMASNPWTYYNKSGTSASIASTAITSGYTQVKVTDNSTYSRGVKHAVSTAVGSSSQPVYIDASGNAIACSTSMYRPNLFEMKWTDHLLNDISWLRANTFSWQSSNVYQAAYNKLVEEYDASTSVEETEEVPWTQPILSANGTLGGDNFAVSADTSYSTRQAYMSFDGNLSTKWGKNNATTGSLTFYNPVPIKVTKITQVPSTDYPSEDYGTYTLYGSNNNSTWTQLCQVTVVASTTATYVPTTPGYYKYYKITQTDGYNYSGTGNLYITAVTAGITSKTSANGFKIALADQESAILSKYNSEGIAWYYILDTTNKRFKLPRTSNIEIHGQLIDEQLGISGYRIYQDGYCEQWGQTTMTGYGSVNTVHLTKTLANIDYQVLLSWTYETTQGDHGSTAAYRASGKTINSFIIFSCFENYNPIVTWRVCGQLAPGQHSSDIEEQYDNYKKYLYFYVGEYSQTAIEQTAGITSEQLNAKVDKANCKTVNVIIDSYVDGTSGYRIWDDGYCEQWGRSSITTNGTGNTFTLLKTYKDTNWNITGAKGDGDTASVGLNLEVASTNTFNAGVSYPSALTRPLCWVARGYLADGEY